MLNILAANVSAHMMQFNVSEDLTFNSKFIFDNNMSGLALSIKLNNEIALLDMVKWEKQLKLH